MLPIAPLIPPATPVSSTGFAPGATVRGYQSGLLPQAQTVYFTPLGVQSTYLPLYIAQGNETVIRFQMASRIGNGAAHTDTYTVVKNGVDTTMTLAVTNASSGSTTTNPVSLVAGDTIGIKVVTDAGTVAEDVVASMTIN